MPGGAESMPANHLSFGASAQSVQQAIRAYLPGAGTVSVSRAEPNPTCWARPAGA